MALSDAERRILETEFDNLTKAYLSEGWPSGIRKEAIIDFCVNNDIMLYNISPLKWSDGLRMINHFIEMMLLPDGNPKQVAARIWKEELDRFMDADRTAAIQEALSADLSIGAQNTRTGSVKPDSLLTMKDMEDLFKIPVVNSTGIIASAPFSLTEVDDDKIIALGSLCNSAQGKELFFPVHDDGHWFSLQRDREGTWFIQDSQPKGAEPSPRQSRMIDDSTEFLSRIGQRVKPELKTTGNQHNDYDCGTQVINAYRTAATGQPHEQTHQATIEELLRMQTPGMAHELTSYPPQLTEQEEKVIEITTAGLEDYSKFLDYKRNLQELIAKRKDNATGNFADDAAITKTNLSNLDDEIKAENESDEEFAARLQEAEFRNAGLK